MDDGRYANNGWMQELPDPITKMTWDNAVLVSRKTARELGVANGDLVEISLNGKTCPARSGRSRAWRIIRSASRSVMVAKRQGASATGVGFNAYKIFNGKYIETGATIRKTGATHVIATTQHHWSMEGRPAVREANLARIIERRQKKFAEEDSGRRAADCRTRFIRTRSMRRRKPRCINGAWRLI